MEDDVMAIIDFTNLLLDFTGGSEIASDHIPGIHRILGSILELGHSLNRRQMTPKALAGGNAMNSLSTNLPKP
jgi:hypothetical protein